MEREILIYGFDQEGKCPYCDRAKRFLKEKNVPFTFKEVLDHKPELMEKRGLETLSGQTVPQVFIDGEYIGGYTELKKIL